jgi:hypothetical protein
MIFLSSIDGAYTQVAERLILKDVLTKCAITRTNRYWATTGKTINERKRVGG